MAETSAMARLTHLIWAEIGLFDSRVECAELAAAIIRAGWRPPLKPSTIDWTGYSDVVDPLAQFKENARRPR